MRLVTAGVMRRDSAGSLAMFTCFLRGSMEEPFECG